MSKQINSFKDFVEISDVKYNLDTYGLPRTNQHYKAGPDYRAGVYIFRNKVSSTLYIGSSVCLRARWYSHLLTTNKLAPELSQDFVEQGLESFDYHAVYTEDYMKYEKWLFNCLRKEVLYNERAPHIYTWFKDDVLYGMEESGVYRAFYSYEEVCHTYSLSKRVIQDAIKYKKYHKKHGVYFSWFLFDSEELQDLIKRDATIVTINDEGNKSYFRNCDWVCKHYGLSRSKVYVSLKTGKRIKKSCIQVEYI